MDTELLSWFSNFINFMILAYISIAVVNTKCFSLSQLNLSLGGLVASIFVNVNSIVLRNK